MKWEAPGGPRRPGETFRETLERIAWEQAGVLLSQARLLGGLRRISRSSDSSIRGGNHVDYSVWFLAESRDLLPFSDEFEAEDRLLIEPGLVPSLIKPWSPLMDDMLGYVQAARTMSRFLVEV